MSFDRLELPCIWVPDGCEMPPLPWGDPAIFPAIFIPDCYQGPRPGYPWIEFGRLTLPSEPMTATARADRVAASGGIAPAFTTLGDPGQRASALHAETAVPDAAPGQFVAGPPTPGAEDAAKISIAGRTYPDVGGAIESWNALSDLRTTMAALAAASESDPIVTSLAENRRKTSFPLAGHPQLAASSLRLERDTAAGDVEPVNYYTSDISNSTAGALGMSRDQLRAAIHSLKRAAGLGGADNVIIHIPSGEVFFNGESIGNLHDE